MQCLGINQIKYICTLKAFPKTCNFNNTIRNHTIEFHVENDTSWKLSMPRILITIKQ